jgi:protein involved in polysaccharide export with SLBB domain
MIRISCMLLMICMASAIGAQTSDPVGLSRALGLTTPEPPAPAVAPPQVQPAKPVATEPVPAAPDLRSQSPQAFDYSVNRASDVFGANLFTGTFARQGATQFNPDYVIAVGDAVQVRMWGAFVFESLLNTDPQGNIFLPHVGPVKVLGVRNQELQGVVEAAVRRVFRANVYSYASLAAAQPVRIFVSGFVNRPGLYSGTSMDSLLHYLDQAGGIDAERGSFLNVQVKRGSTVRSTINLYEFLLDGRMPLVQFASGDVIFVPPRQNSIKVSGLVDNAKRFEFEGASKSIADFIRLAKPYSQATHTRVIRNTGNIRNVEYYPIGEAERVSLTSGDELEFTSDRRPGTITVRVEGEHQSAQEYVLPYGSRLGDLTKQIRYTERSDQKSIQLFRLSVKDRQAAMLQTALKSLEASVLTARSSTNDEARLRKDEAELILQWVERAKKIEPRGHVVIAQADTRDNLLLENSDVVRIPALDGLVLINGEVLFPTTVAHDSKLALDEYIRKAGGYAQNADTSRVIIARRDGSFIDTRPLSDNWFSGNGTQPQVQQGDEILVLPKVDVKSRQILKDLTLIIYQIAVSAKVIFGL